MGNIMVLPSMAQISFYITCLFIKIVQIPQYIKQINEKYGNTIVKRIVGMRSSKYHTINYSILTDLKTFSLKEFPQFYSFLWDLHNF
jgi:hypothetical protein